MKRDFKQKKRKGKLLKRRKKRGNLKKKSRNQKLPKPRPDQPGPRPFKSSYKSWSRQHTFHLHARSHDCHRVILWSLPVVGALGLGKDIRPPQKSCHGQLGPSKFHYIPPPPTFTQFLQQQVQECGSWPQRYPAPPCQGRARLAESQRTPPPPQFLPEFKPSRRPCAHKQA